MPFYTKKDFLKGGIKPSTVTTGNTTTTATPDPTCDICYESVPVVKPQNQFAASVEYMGGAARSIFFGADKTKSHYPKAKSSHVSTRSNAMMEIKACGHRFCRACLDKWLADQNTCPMCRDLLFFLDERRSFVLGEPRVLSRQEVMEIRDIGAPAASRVEARSGFRVEERQSAWDYRNLWDAVVYTHAGRLEEWSTDLLEEIDAATGRDDVLVVASEPDGPEGIHSTRDQGGELQEGDQVEDQDQDHDDEGV